MAFFPRPVTIVMLRMPASTASSITYWIRGLSTKGNISLGCALVAGKKRVPKPAAGKTALEMRMLLLAPQIIVGSFEPVLPRRRKDIEIERVFQGRRGMHDIGRNVKDVAGVKNDFHSVYVKFQPAADDVTHLFVLMVMSRNDASFLQYEFGEHHPFARDEFSSQQRIKLFLGDVGPTILCDIPTLCLFHICSSPYGFALLLGLRASLEAAPYR